MARTIQSPGVEIKEVDLSLRPQLPVGTTIFITGFSPQGPTDEVLQVASLSEFEQVYGKPTNAAERYFYHTVRGSFQSPANVLVSRLPYGSGTGDGTQDKYSALFYPVIGLSGTNTSASTPDSTFYHQVTSLAAGETSVIGTNFEHHLSASDLYVIGEPSYVTLTEAQYQQALNQEFTWNTSASAAASDCNLNTFSDISKAGIVILNSKKFSVNNKFEGYYVGISDNTNLNPASDFDGILNLQSLNKNSASTLSPDNYVTVPETRLTFGLSAASTQGVEGSVSEVLENVSVFDLATTEFDDTISIGIFKVRQSTTDPDANKLDYVLAESHVGSMNFFRQQFKQDGGNATSFFIENEAANSPNFKILVNPSISKLGGDWLNDNGVPQKRVRVLSNKTNAATGQVAGSTVATRFINETEQQAISAAESYLHNVANFDHAEELYPHGVYKEANAQTREIGTLPSKLDRVFELVENYELFPIDITVDAGLSTIWVGSSGGTGNFDDEEYYDIDSLYTTSIIESPGNEITRYRTITNRFIDFAANKRKDNIFISDSLRYIFVQGQNNKTLSDKNKNFSQHIYWPLRHIYGAANTSYGSAYANWVKTYDDVINKQVWVPISGRIAAMYANTDSNFQPWFAPAGFTRGVLNTVSDLAFYPKQKHRDQLYKINMNPVANFPNDGFVVFGQKTLQTKPSAFDRVNVRRLFLNLEKATRATVKYFVFEPNTLFTRTQVINVLTPIFENAKNTQGLYDYLIICDERNNTPDVIDQNELVVDIYLKPVRAAEFILVNFYATRTGQDFSELVS